MEDKRNMMETTKLTATCHQESEGYYLVTIDGGQGIKGVLYFPKNEPIPSMVTVLVKQGKGWG